MKIPVYKDPDFIIEVEFNRRNMLFVHNSVSRYSPKIKVRIQQAFDSVKESLARDGVRKLFTLVKGEKTIKYNLLFGFQKTGIIDKVSGAELLMMKLEN